jgi:hypothetical protein
MRRSLITTALVLAAGALYFVGCTDSTRVPTEPPSLKRGGVPAPQARINALIRDAFSSKADRNNAQRQMARIKNALARGDVEEGQAFTLVLMDFVRENADDINAAADLTAELLAFAQISGTAGVIGPTGGDLVSPDLQVAVSVGEDALLGDELISFFKKDQPCFPDEEIPEEEQFDDCYTFEPVGLVFEEDVRVEVCLDLPVGDPNFEPARLHGRDDPGPPVVLVAVPHLLIECVFPVASTGSSGIERFARAGFNRLISLFSPEPLFAANPLPPLTSLGGMRGSFTDIGWALPQAFFNPATGNYYQAFATRETWADARDAADDLSFGVCEGHLATITSAAENAFIVTNMPQVAVAAAGSGLGGGYWIGGFQPAGSPEPGGGWAWVTGEPFSYTNWATTPEPNNSGGEESMQFIGDWRPEERTMWNDEGGFKEYGYVVEYECPSPVIIDGVLQPGEWLSATQFSFDADLPGGGTTPATLFVMNDANNLYLAVKFERTVADAFNLLNFEFDTNNNTTGPEPGDDYFTFTPSGGFSDAHRSTGCPSSCGVTNDNADGAGAFANDGTFSVYELSHPLNSGEAGDFALIPPATIGMQLLLRVGDGETDVTTMYPGGEVFPTYVAISINIP